MSLDIIIIGAGIAGLAAARALREEHTVVVLEASSLKQEVGAAIHLGPNASKIALKWGMDLDRLNSPEVNYYTEISQAGKVVIQQEVDTRRDFGSPWLLNHRVDLHNELRRLATNLDGPGQPATIRTGARVASVDATDGTITLEDGEVLHGDVLIGADGIHSVARTAVLGSKQIAQPSGHSAYRCLIPSEKLAGDEQLKWLADGTNTGITTWVSPDRRVVAYPCRGSSLLNIVAIVPDKVLENDSVESWSAAGSVEEMVASFSTYDDNLQRLLGYVESCGLWQLRDQDPLPTWTKDRLILIGDAAHAMLPHQGQGGGQSIEDAEALGVYLAGLTKPDVAQIPAVLNQVERVRIERASTIQGYSREKALGARKGADGMVTLNASEYAGYNFSYDGADKWAHRMGLERGKGKVGGGLESEVQAEGRGVDKVGLTEGGQSTLVKV